MERKESVIYQILVLTFLSMMVILYLASVRKPLSHSNDKSFSRSVRTDKESSNNKCTIYLASLSLPRGGLGIFTVKNLRKRDIFLPADGTCSLFSLQSSFILNDYQIACSFSFLNLVAYYCFHYSSIIFI